MNRLTFLLCTLFLIDCGQLLAEQWMPLALDGENLLTGQIQIADQTFSVKLADRDQDGVFDGRGDRLYIDLDKDGRFHPLQEQFAANRPVRLNPTKADRPQKSGPYQLVLKTKPWRARLVVNQGTGYITPVLGHLTESTNISKAEATLASRSGIHRTIHSIETRLELPVGNYRIQEVSLWANDGKFWSIGFSNFNSSAPFSIEITEGDEQRVELLGPLKLSQSIGSGDLLQGKMSFNPKLVSKTGLTVTRCLAGAIQPSDESRLTATLFRPESDETREVIDMRTSGFACGSLCPIAFQAAEPIVPEMMLALDFDCGPLGGKLNVTAPVRLPGAERIDNADDLLELLKRKTK